MLQYKHLRRMAGILLLLTVVTLSCQFGPSAATRQVTQGEQAILPTIALPTEQPKQLPTNTAAPAIPTATPTTPPAKVIQPVAADKIDAASVTSGADGAAQFADKLSGAQLTVTVEKHDDQQPVGNINVWFASRGTELLVMAVDPAGNYAPLLQTLTTQALQGAKLVEKVSLTPLQTVTKDPQAWEAYLKALPDLSAWVTGAQELCAPPEKLMKQLPFQSDGLLLGRPDDKTIADWVRQPYYLGVGAGGMLLSAFPNQMPTIPRWQVGRVGANGPALAIPTGFCLWPLDRQNDQSVATWVNYGLQHKDVYPFTRLAVFDKIGYANYLEGGQPNLTGDVLVDIDRHLKNGAQCDGYGIASDYLQVWTSGWNPLWEIKLMCYVEGCKQLDTPATSDIAAFFFTKDNNNGWVLSTIWQNKPDLWKDVYQLSLTACPSP